MSDQLSIESTPLRAKRARGVVLLACLSLLLAGLRPAQGQTLLFSESFESPGGDYGYFLDPPNDCGCCENNDQWGRTTGLGLFSCSGIAAADYPPTGISGTYFFGAEDVDDPDIQTPAGAEAPFGVLYLDTVNANGYIKLQVEVDLATPISSTTAPPGYVPAGPFEADDSVLFQYAFNTNILDTSFVTFAALRANASGDLAVDSDGDGTIDGIALDSAFRRFTFDLPQNGKMLAIRVVFAVNDAQEEVALDRIQVSGCAPPSPPAAIIGDTLICKGDSSTISLVGGSLGDWSDWQWYEGTCGGVPVGTGASITVAPGTTTNYFVGPIGGCVPITSCRGFRVYVKDLVGSFSATTPTAGCVPMLVDFEDNTPGAASWNWRFYDEDAFPGVSTGSTPSFLYDVFGDYDVQLVVTDTLGCVDTVYASGFVQAQGSDAFFSADVVSGCNPLNVTFSDTSASYSSIVDWAWTFGDGGSATAAAPSYSYADGGVYDVALTVTDANGCVSSLSKSEYILTDTIAPTVAFPPGNQDLAADAACSVSLPDFRASAVVGDACAGTVVLAQNPAPGTPLAGVGSSTTVWLVATDGGGNADSVSFTATVVDTTAPSLTAVVDQTLYADAACSANLPDYSGLSTVADFCDPAPAVSQVPVAGTLMSGAGTSQLVWLIAEDASGNADSISFTVVLADSTAPAVAFPPGDQVLTLDGSCNATLPDFRGSATVADACDGAPALVQVPAAGGVYSGDGTVVPVWIYATDASGNVDSVGFNATLEDQTAPALTAVADQVQVLDASCQVSLDDFRALSTITDNCDPAPAVTQSPAPGSLYSGVGTVIPVRIYATDLAGNVDSIAFTVSLADSTAPSLTAVVDQTLYADAACSANLPDYSGLSTVADFCDPAPAVSQVPVAGTPMSGAGTSQLVWLIAEDASGNADSISFTVVLADSTAPSIVFAAGDQVVAADASCSATLIDYRSGATVSDACDLAPVVLQVPAPGTVISGAGTSIPVWLFATDASGNVDSTTFDFTVLDVTAPTMPAIPDQVQWLDAACQTNLMDYRSLATPSDNCDTVPVLTQSPAPGTLLSGAGTEVVTITATDASGNAFNVAFTLNLNDPLPPSMSLPADQDLLVDMVCTFVMPDYRPMVSASDNCDPAPVLVQSPAPGSVQDGSMGPVEVTMTLTDASGYFTTGSFFVNPIDNVAPTLVCPASSDILVSGLCTGPIPDFTTEVSAMDNCDAALSILQSPAPGTLLVGAGATATVTVTATDDAGNASTCPIVVTVVDDEPPVVTCPADDVVVLNDGCKAELEDYTPLVSASDNCEIVGMAQSPPAGTLLTGHGTSQLVQFSVWDIGGDTTTCSFTLSFVDTASPSIPVVVDTTVAVDTSCIAVVPDLVDAWPANDNCTAPADLLYTQSPVAGTAIVDTTMVLLTARDMAGNEASRMVRINVNQELAPVFETCPADINVVTDTSSCGAMVSWEEPVANAFCYSYTTEATHNAGSFFEPGFYPVFYTVTNELGLTASCAFGVTVQDNEAPVVDCPGDTTIIQDQLPFFYDAPTASDNCGVYSNALVDGIGGGIYPLGSTDEVYQVVDSAGNATVCSFVVTLERNPVNGIDDPENLHVLEVYPNPTSGRLFVDVQSPDVVQLRLVDALGRLRLHRQVPPSGTSAGSIQTLDLSTLPAGIYYVFAEGEGWIRSARVIAVD